MQDFANQPNNEYPQAYKNQGSRHPSSTADPIYNGYLSSKVYDRIINDHSRNDKINRDIFRKWLQQEALYQMIYSRK